MSSENTQIQVLGFGTAALGLAIGADRLGLLDEFLKQGVIFHERTLPSDYNSLRYRISSNSPALDFLCGIKPDGLFAPVLQSKLGRMLIQYGANAVPLELVSEFFSQISRVFVNHLSKFKKSGVLYNSHVEKLVRTRDMQYVSYDRAGNVLSKSSSVVIATGAEQILNSFTEYFPSVNVSVPGVTADRLLRGEDSQIISTIKHKKIIIIGGSHSALSAAEYLLNHFDSAFADGQIQLFHRGKIYQYYPSLEHAKEDNVNVFDEVIHEETGELNKFNGLRGNTKLLYRKILSGTERRIKIIPLDAGSTLSDIQEIGFFIQATGYTPRKISLFDYHGKEIRIKYTRNNIALTPQNNVLSELQDIIPNLFAIGLGHASLGSSGYKTAVNFFHGEAASHILLQLLIGSNGVTK